MKLYYNIHTFETHTISDEMYELWAQTGNIKVFAFVLVPPQPAYNPTLQFEPFFKNGEWAILDKTPEDIKADSEDLSHRNEGSLLKSLYLALADGSGTALERLLRTERVCAYLIKQLR